MAKRYLLDFEKPLVELEKQIEQIKELARDSEVDVSQQLLQLETLATRRREEIFKSLNPAQKIQVARLYLLCRIERFKYFFSSPSS